MKQKGKHLLARLLSAVLAVTVLAATAIPALAEENGYNYTDPYVLVYEGLDSIDEAYQEYCKPYLYVSPHRTSMGIRNLETGVMEYWSCSQKVYNLINTNKIPQGGDGAYASIEAYCVDACVNAGGGSSYRRINLEDSTYFDDHTAGRIRAVYKNSFPYIKDMEVITKQVNDWLDQQGGEHTDVSGLTAAEVVTAAQYTIWILANGEDVIPRDSYYRSDTYTAEELADTVIYVTDEYMDCTEGVRDTTDNNITLVQQYLQNLAPVAAEKKVVSDELLTVDGYSKSLQQDGTYTVTVHYTVNTLLNGGDDLTLTASYGDTRQNVSLTEANLSGSLELIGVKPAEDVTLEVNGIQTGGDVYLFDSLGDRTVSQSMIGYDESSLPVHAEVNVNNADHILQIFKTTDQEDGKKPLANIEFDLYRVASMEQIASGEVILSKEPTDEEIAKYQSEANLVTTLKTDAAGFASYNLTQNGQEDGVYLVVEKENPAVVTAIHPFFVAIPGTDIDGVSTVNVVTVQPKNTVETGPEIRKDVTEIENDHGTFDVDQVHTWIIRGDVPAGLAQAVEYQITDTLDRRLTYKGNVAVKVGMESDPAGTEAVTLNEGTHYTLTVGEDQDEDGNTVDAFVIALTQEGMKAVAAAAADGAGEAADYEVRVYFDAVININASMGEIIPNSADLKYTNSAGVEYEDESDVPEVHTGGLNLLKVDSSDRSVLAGASFRVARDATQEELSDDSVLTETLTVDGEEHQVVFVTFHDTADLSGEKVGEVTTGQDGKAVIYGLAYGEYYIVETKAPAEYNLLDAPLTVQVGEESHGDEQTVTVYNAKFVLPETGGMGTVFFTVTGGVMVAAGALFIFLFTVKKKQRI